MANEQVRRAMQMAKEIIDQSWIDAGMSREHLDMDEKVVALFDALVGAGYPMEDLLDEWQTKTHEQILCEYPPKLDALRKLPERKLEPVAA